MNRITMKVFVAALVAVSLLLLFAACDAIGAGETGDWGVMRLSLTDAPLMASGVNGVYITVEEILYNNSEDEWVPTLGFDGPKTYNLLDLQNGKTALLGDLLLPAGEYEQIRFMLGAQERSGSKKGPPVTAGSWVEFGDDDVYDETVDEALFVPSGAQTGYKATADEPFTVPPNGMIEITADFDLRRSVVVAGSRYLLKPVLRLVINAEVGQIVGDVTGNEAGFDYVAYAYKAGVFNEDEKEENDDGVRFPNAVTSSEVVPDPDDPDFVLSFLPVETYTVVIAKYLDGEYQDAAALGLGVEVTAGGTTTLETIDVSGLDDPSGQ